MSLRSKNFLFKRLSQDGREREYAESDSWFPNNQDYKWNEVTMPMAAGGYYGSTNGMHTISFTLRNFTGRIYVQATLASNPTEEDWFYIEFKQSCCKFLEFTDYRVTKTDGVMPNNQYGTTGTIAETLIGNFTYLRIGIDRSYIAEVPSLFQKQYAGKLEEILINF